MKLFSKKSKKKKVKDYKKIYEGNVENMPQEMIEEYFQSWDKQFKEMDKVFLNKPFHLACKFSKECIDKGYTCRYCQNNKAKSFFKEKKEQNNLKEEIQITLTRISSQVKCKSKKVCKDFPDKCWGCENNTAKSFFKPLKNIIVDCSFN